MLVRSVLTESKVSFLPEFLKALKNKIHRRYLKIYPKICRKIILRSHLTYDIINCVLT